MAFFKSAKNLTIDYNIVNLPARISSVGARKPGEDPIDFLHTYGGERVRKGNNSYAEGYESSEDGNVYHFGDGRIVYEEGDIIRFLPRGFLRKYKITDHLGNTVVLFFHRNPFGRGQRQRRRNSHRKHDHRPRSLRSPPTQRLLPPDFFSGQAIRDALRRDALQHR